MKIERFNGERFLKHPEYDNLLLSNKGRVISSVRGYEALVATRLKGRHIIATIRRNKKYKLFYVAKEMIKVWLCEDIKTASLVGYKDGNCRNLNLDNLVYLKQPPKYKRHKELNDSSFRKPREQNRIFVGSSTGIYGVRYWRDNKTVVFRSNLLSDCKKFDKWQKGKTKAEIEKYPKPEATQCKHNIYLCDATDKWEVSKTPYEKPIILAHHRR